MANDVYTTIRFDDNADWDLFTAGIAEIEYKHSQPFGFSGMNKLIAVLFPEEKGNYYDWYNDKSCEVIDTKWCNIHNVDEGSIEFHSAWNAPTGIINRIQNTFDKFGMCLRIEDYDCGIIGDVKPNTLQSNGLHYEKGDGWEVRCLSASYYNKYVAALKGHYKSAKELLADTSYHNDEVIDRYEAVSFINPVFFDNVDWIVSELSVNAVSNHKITNNGKPTNYCLKDLWKFDKDKLLNGLSNTSLKEALMN